MWHKSASKSALRAIHLSTKRLAGAERKVWSELSSRSNSLSIKNAHVKQSLFEGGKPASIVNIERKSAYNSPIGIDDTFQLAYEELTQQSAANYALIAELEKQLAGETDSEIKAQLQSKIDKVLVDAEIYNPEVLYNFEYDPELIDASQPVYRKLLQDKWKSHDLMVLMQRLEQLHVIPDTLPTLDPKVEVKVKFPHNTKSEFSSWVEPGTVLPAFAVSKPPTIEITLFSGFKDEQSLYTVILVNPDEPDLKTNSFTTKLHYGLANVPLTNADNQISSAKLLAKGDDYTFSQYVPVLPEKNAQMQRACLWVFKQSEPVQIGKAVEEDGSFNIRSFAAAHNLTAVGAHVWRQSFDRSVNSIREQYHLPPGRIFHRVRKTDPYLG